jgi:hypothetical protein
MSNASPPTNNEINTAVRNANSAFKALVTAMSSENGAPANKLNAATTAIRKLQNLKKRNTAGVAAALGKPVNATAKPSMFAGIKSMAQSVGAAVSGLVSRKSAVTNNSVSLVAASVTRAITFANKLKRKGGLRAAIGGVITAPQSAARGMAGFVSRIGKAYNAKREGYGKPTNINYKKTINRYKKNKLITASNLTAALALQDNTSKNNYISWPILYVGTKNANIYSSNIVNYARTEAKKSLEETFPGINLEKSENRNLLNALMKTNNRRSVIKEKVKNYERLKTLVGAGQVNNYIGVNTNLINLRRTALGGQGVNLVSAAAKKRVDDTKIAANTAARGQLISQLYKGMTMNTYNVSTSGNKTPLQKALALRFAGNIRNVKLTNAQKALLQNNGTAVYNAAKKLRSIQKVGNKIVPRNTTEAKLILNAANLASVDPTKADAVKNKLSGVGITVNKYNFTKIDPLKLTTKQEQNAVTHLKNAKAAANTQKAADAKAAAKVAANAKAAAANKAAANKAAANKAAKIIKLQKNITIARNAAHAAALSANVTKAESEASKALKLKTNLNSLNPEPGVTTSAQAQVNDAQGYVLVAKQKADKKKFNENKAQFNRVKNTAKLASLKGIMNRMETYAANTNENKAALAAAKKHLTAARRKEFLQEVWSLTSGGANVTKNTVNSIKKRIFDKNAFTQEDMNAITALIPTSPPNSPSIIGWKSGIGGRWAGANSNYMNRKAKLNAALGISAALP